MEPQAPRNLTRRAALRVGGAGLFGLSLPRLLAAAESPKAKARATAKSVIFLHQWGGPGQHETFDPKPEAPDNVRGWYGVTKTQLPGVIFGERIPKLAAMADLPIVIKAQTSDRIQEMHIKLIHTVIETVERQLFPENY